MVRKRERKLEKELAGGKEKSKFCVPFEKGKETAGEKAVKKKLKNCLRGKEGVTKFCAPSNGKERKKREKRRTG